MDPNSCREQLANILSREIAGLDELTRLLAHEHQLLEANDVDALEKAMVDRQARVGSLLRVEDERRSLCRALGYPPDKHGLEQMMRWCDPAATLRVRWADCADRATRCREQNDCNGALVNARLKRVESLLGTLTGRPTEGRTYGRKGAYAAPTSGRMLAVEA